MKSLTLLFVLFGTYSLAADNFIKNHNLECQSNEKGQACVNVNDGIFLAFTKQARGKDDDNRKYKSYLKKQVVTGNTVSSPGKVSDINNSGIMWVRSLHKDSEMPNSSTVYLAATKANEAYLVSLSAINSQVGNLSKLEKELLKEGLLKYLKKIK